MELVGSLATIQQEGRHMHRNQQPGRDKPQKIYSSNTCSSLIVKQSTGETRNLHVRVWVKKEHQNKFLIRNRSKQRLTNSTGIPGDKRQEPHHKTIVDTLVEIIMAGYNIMDKVVLHHHNHNHHHRMNNYTSTVLDRDSQLRCYRNTKKWLCSH